MYNDYWLVIVITAFMIWTFDHLGIIAVPEQLRAKTKRRVDRWAQWGLNNHHHWRTLQLYHIFNNKHTIIARCIQTMPPFPKSSHHANLPPQNLNEPERNETGISIIITIMIITKPNMFFMSGATYCFHSESNIKIWNCFFFEIIFFFWGQFNSRDDGLGQMLGEDVDSSYNRFINANYTNLQKKNWIIIIMIMMICKLLKDLQD